MTDTNAPVQHGSHRVLKKFAYLFSAHWVRELFQTAFQISLARMSEVTFGEFMLAMSIGQILRFVSECGLNQHLSAMLARKDNYPTVLLTQFTLIKFFILSIAWLVMLGFIFWQGYTPGLKMLVIIIATGVGLETLVSSFYVVFQILGRQDVEGRLRSLGAALGFGYGLTALALGLPSLAVGFFKLIETLTTMSGASFAMIRRLKFRAGIGNFKSIWATWKSSIVFTLMSVAAIFYNKINIFFLKNAAGPEGVAQYSVTWQTVEGICALVSGMLLGKVLFPILTRLWVHNKDEFKNLAQDTARWLLAASVIVMFVLFIESDRIILLIYGPKYHDAVWMQRWLVPAVLCAFIHNLAAYLMISVSKQNLLLVFYILGLLVNLVLCAVLIPSNPLMGTCLAIVLTKAIVGCMTVGYCQIRFQMIPLRSLLFLLLACGAGAGLYVAGKTWLFREAAEALALVPVVWLAWQWRKQFNENAAQAKKNQA